MSRTSIQPGLSRRRGAVSKGCGVGLGVLGVLLLAGLLVSGKYNSLVATQENVEGRWGEVENQYKRRYDLIPNLVETVKGAADFEKSTLEAVVEARSKVGSARLPDKMPTDEKELAAYVAAQQGLSGALGRLFALAENYPQLRATENFRTLQDQLEGTENRIGVARRDYIDAVQGYNTQRRKFPTNMVAGLFGFEEAAQFSAPEGESENPQVDFGTDDDE